jgi:signal transduction histidine kinase
LSCDESNKKMSGNWARTLDPRSSLAARIAWVFGILSILMSALAGFYVANMSRQVVEQEIGALYASRAQHIADAIDIRIQGGSDTMQLAASVLGSLEQIDGGVVTETLVDNMRSHLGDALWVGVTDVNGAVLAGDDNRLEGKNLSSMDWFKSAQGNRYVSGPVSFPALEAILPKIGTNGDKTRRFLLITVPIKNESAAILGYAIACFDMSWIEEIQLRAGESLADARPIDLFLLDGQGKMINASMEGVVPPETNLSDRIKQTMSSIPDKQSMGYVTTDNYLVGFSRSKALPGSQGTGWVSVVRESKLSAYRPADKTALTIALSCLALGLGLTLAAALGTRYILQGLSGIAKSADALRLEQADEFVEAKGNDEVARISHSLATLFNKQKKTNEELLELNKNLDQKVAERTRDVLRLSEETRVAAFTRDRLRMSRDLHDTLAHSMLAMLTQIRLIQKLYKRKPELVAEELGNAEQAAQEGLNLARDAVTELRYFAVRDDGLAAALQKLIKKLKERMEIDVVFHIDDLASGLARPKAETAYRIVEEALHNIEKHSDATEAKLNVALDRSNPANELLSVSIEDNGRGFDPARPTPGHFGLLGMREQADILNGKFNVTSEKGNGTRVLFEVVL